MDIRSLLIGLAIGAAACLAIYVRMKIKLACEVKKAKGDAEKYKTMLTERMEVESEGISKMKAETEKLRKENENLRISLQTYSQKPGRKELSRLQVYQTAVDRLTLNSPGFGSAWQAALKESEEEFEKTFLGQIPFIRKLIPTKTDATVIKEIEESN